MFGATVGSYSNDGRLKGQSQQRPSTSGESGTLQKGVWEVITCTSSPVPSTNVLACHDSLVATQADARPQPKRFRRPKWLIHALEAEEAAGRKAALLEMELDLEAQYPMKPPGVKVLSPQYKLSDRSRSRSPQRGTQLPQVRSADNSRSPAGNRRRRSPSTKRGAPVLGDRAYAPPAQNSAAAALLRALGAEHSGGIVALRLPELGDGPRGGFAEFDPITDSVAGDMGFGTHPVDSSIDGAAYVDVNEREEPFAVVQEDWTSVRAAICRCPQRC